MSVGRWCRMIHTTSDLANAVWHWGGVRIRAGVSCVPSQVLRSSLCSCCCGTALRLKPGLDRQPTGAWHILPSAFSPHPSQLQCLWAPQPRCFPETVKRKEDEWRYLSASGIRNNTPKRAWYFHNLSLSRVSDWFFDLEKAAECDIAVCALLKNSTWDEGQSQSYPATVSWRAPNEIAIDRPVSSTYLLFFIPAKVTTQPSIVLCLHFRATHIWVKNQIVTE